MSVVESTKMVLQIHLDIAIKTLDGNPQGKGKGGGKMNKDGRSTPYGNSPFGGKGAKDLNFGGINPDFLGQPNWNNNPQDDVSDLLSQLFGTTTTSTSQSPISDWQNWNQQQSQSPMNNSFNCLSQQIDQFGNNLSQQQFGNDNWGSQSQQQINNPQQLSQLDMNQLDLSGNSLIQNSLSIPQNGQLDNGPLLDLSPGSNNPLDLLFGNSTDWSSNNGQWNNQIDNSFVPGQSPNPTSASDAADLLGLLLQGNA